MATVKGPVEGDVHPEAAAAGVDTDAAESCPGDVGGEQDGDAAGSCCDTNGRARTTWTRARCRAAANAAPLRPRSRRENAAKARDDGGAGPDDAGDVPGTGTFLLRGAKVLAKPASLLGCVGLAREWSRTIRHEWRARKGRKGPG